MRLIPRDFARQHLVLSAGLGDGAGIERLLVSGRSDACAVFNVGVRLGTRVAPVVLEDEELARRIDGAYGSVGRPRGGDEGGGAAAEDVERLLQLADRDLLSTEGKGPVVRLVDGLLFEAVSGGASDVHVQPLADRTLVRYRLDGVLQTVGELPVRLTAPIVSRIKVMGRMDIAERRVPQDGRATVTLGSGRSVDLRISTLPTSYGERAVLRLLDVGHGPGLEDFAGLGMAAGVERGFLACAGRSSGIVLVTGPTGSGKTTTLYTTLRWLATRGEARRAGTEGSGAARALLDGGDLNIMTIEDPIEYELATAGLAISQAQVNSKKGITFAGGLRHILRQDPDVIMVGEIRDAETARIAIQASLTGHLVFSTLHTNDAATAVTRLLDLGVEPYLVASSVSAVLAQRLLRLRHGACGGEGCGACFGSGYSGRTAIFELITIDDAVRELISGGSSAGAIRVHVRRGGVRGLEEEGEALVEAGRTTRAELARVVGGLA
ncbi:MAG: type II/IV secretion system protein [Phycisphaerales bacterium]|nr:type II/IV secretion system protein [Phycisphaerales bacterium]